MILYKSAKDLSEYLIRQRENGHSIGFVPTMGALHNGHLGLISHSIKKSSITVASIFVNPTQFNDPEDYAKYPVTLDNDLFLLEQAGCHAVFIPSVHEIYPDGLGKGKQYELGYLESILEGKYRPGHFQGVCRVVDRLLEIVEPTMLFLGQKDYQQCMVIKKLIALTGRSTKLGIIPTTRETSGLAMSSRNLRLSETDKAKATGLYEALTGIKENIATGDLESVLAKARDHINQGGFDKTDYVTIADADTLETITVWDGKPKLVALAAAYISGVRLIDNMLLN